MTTSDWHEDDHEAKVDMRLWKKLLRYTLHYRRTAITFCFVALGLASRLSALALFLFNAVAVYAYASFLFGNEGAAGLQQHILWGMMLLVTVFHGPGKLSLDHWLCKKC